jgi:tetratricopeptide (TPR) repeat protein
MMGEELLQEQKPEKAVPFYERAVAQDPSKLVYYMRLGVADFLSQRYSAASEVCISALKRFPDNARLLFLLGYTARAQGQYDDAISAFRRALTLEPDNANVLANLGYIAGQRGQSGEAEQLLRKAINLDRNNFPAHHDLGRLLVKLKRYEEALSVLERGAKLNNKDAGIHYQLFLAYSRLKQKENADAELATFKQLDGVAAHAPTPLGADKRGVGIGDTEALPPLPASISGEAGHSAPGQP